MILLLLAALVSLAEPSLLTSVAVLPLRTTGDARPQVTAVLDDLLSASLQSQSRMRVVSKQDLDSILEDARDSTFADRQLRVWDHGIDVERWRTSC